MPAFLKSLLSTLILVFCLNANAATNFYEQAIKAFNEGNYEASFIYLKNSLEQSPRNLPSKILMGKIYLHKAYFDQAVTEFEEALDYNVDINLIISDYATALNFAKRYKEVLTLGDGYNLTPQSRYELLLNKAIAYKNLNLVSLARQAYQDAMALFPSEPRAINSLAAFELSEGNTDEALSVALRSVQAHQSDNRSWHLLGNVHLAKNNVEQAITAFEKSLSLFADDPVVRRSLARAYLQANQVEKAKSLVDEILSVTPNDPNMMLISSWILAKQQNNSASAAMLESLANTTSLLPDEALANDPSLIFVKGISAYLLGNFEQASKDLQRYLKQNSADTRAISLLAEVYIRQGKENEAEYLLERYESSVINDKQLASRLVDLYIKNGKRFDAERLLSKLVLAYPDDLTIALKQVDLLNKSGRVLEAKRLIERLDKEQPEQAWRLNLAKGLMYLKEGQFEQAETVANSLLAQYPENTDLLNFKSAIKIKQNEPELAIKLAKQVLAKQPEFFEAQFNLATALNMTGQTAQAKKILSSLLAQRPGNDSVKFMLAKTHIMAGQLEQALPMLESIVSGENGRLSRELLFDVYMSQGEYSQALTTIKALNDLYLYNIDYLFKQVDVLNKLGRANEAKQNLGILFGLAESNTRILYDIAVWQRRLNDFDGAEKTLQRLTKIIPKNLRVRIESARLKLSQGQLAAAQKQAHLLNKEVNNEPNVLLLLADIARAQNDLEQAYLYYEQALKLDPNFNLALVNLFELATEKVFVDNTTVLLQRLAKEFPTQLWRQHMLADHYTNQQQFDLALPLYQALVEQQGFSTNPLLLNNLANLLVTKNQTLAYQYASTAAKLEPENAQIRDTLGWTLYHLNRHEEALAELRNAYAMDASNPTIRYHLAKVLLELKREKEGLIELDYAVNHGAGKAWLEEAQALLEQRR